MKKLFMLLLLLPILTACSVVGPGQKGIRVNLGKAGKESLPSGVYVWFPFVLGMKKINVRMQKSEVESNAASKDMQDVHTVFALNWHIESEKVSDVYTQIGDEDDVFTNILKPAISEALKAATAKKTAEEILTKRHELKDEIDADIKQRMAKYNIAIDEVNITNVKFTDDFTKAVEEKQIAEQRSKQAEYEAQRAQVDAKSAVNKARGEAEANLTLAKAQAESQKLLQTTVSPAILQLKAIEKWNGVMPQMMGSSSNVLFNIPTKGDK